MRNLGRGYEICGEIPVLWRAWSSLWPPVSNPCFHPAAGSRDEARIPGPGCWQGRAGILIHPILSIPKHVPSPGNPCSCLLQSLPCLGWFLGSDSSGRQGQVPLENLLFQQEDSLLGDMAGWVGNVGQGKFPNSEFSPRSLGGSQGSNPGCIPRDFSGEDPSPGSQGVTAGSTGAIQGILAHPEAAGASLGTRQWQQPWQGLACGEYLHGALNPTGMALG